MKKQIQILAAVLVPLFAAIVWGQRNAKSPLGEDDQTTAKLKALEVRIQTLEDIHEIERLQRAYGYYLDKRLWDEIVPLFTEDARVEIGGRGVYLGKAHITNLFKHVMGGGKSGLEYGALHNHMQLQGIVDVDPGGKTAKGRWRAFMQVAILKKSALWAEGPYEVEYAKVGGKWMLSKMRWYPTYYVPYDRGWDRIEASVGGASMETNKEYPPDLPPSEGVRPFPEVSVPPFHYKNPITGK